MIIAIMPLHILQAALWYVSALWYLSFSFVCVCVCVYVIDFTTDYEHVFQKFVGERKWMKQWLFYQSKATFALYDMSIDFKEQT